MTYQTDNIEVTKNGFTLFEGYSVDNQESKKIVFSKNEIKIYKSLIRIKIQPLISPFWVKLNFKKIGENFHISIENFGQHILTFRWNDIKNIPIIIDALSNLYNLEYFGGQSIADGSEELFFRSINGKTSRKIYRLRKPKSKLEFTFTNYYRATAKFDLSKEELSINPSEGIPTKINFNRIKKIVIHLEKVEKQSKFTSFNVNIVRKTGKDITVVNLKDIFGLYSRHYELKIEEIDATWVFNAGMELMELLNNVPELEGIPTEIEF